MKTARFLLLSVCQFRPLKSVRWRRGRYTLQVTHPSGANEPTSAHPSDHPYTSDRYTAESRPGWPDGPDSPPPSIHRLTSTSCKSTLRLNLLPSCDKGLIAPGSWAGRWVIVSGRSPRPAH